MSACRCSWTSRISTCSGRIRTVSRTCIPGSLASPLEFPACPRSSSTKSLQSFANLPKLGGLVFGWLARFRLYRSRFLGVNTISLNIRFAIATRFLEVNSLHENQSKSFKEGDQGRNCAALLAARYGGPQKKTAATHAIRNCFPPPATAEAATTKCVCMYQAGMSTSPTSPREP